ncbi:MAG TPA: ferric reductase-like transmembrane domain-containing protein [Ilumatobacteraceae bacterium]
MIAGTQAWWFLSRGSGIVAWLMLAATNLWGIMMVTRVVRGLRPAWMLDLHRWLGALAIITLGIHLGGLVADTYVHFGWREILVPQGSAWKTGAVTWGVISMYLLVVIELTSLVMKHLPRRVWHSIHLLSYVLFAFATVHGALAGTDSDNRIYIGTVAFIVAFVAIGLSVRLLRARDRRARSLLGTPATIGLARGVPLLGDEAPLDGAEAGASRPAAGLQAGGEIDHQTQPIERVGAVAQLGSMRGRGDPDLGSELGDDAVGDLRR